MKRFQRDRHLDMIYPKCSGLKNIRTSIDCTEFKCEMPRNYNQQGKMYSSYKSHCTMKCLMSVNPNGATCFVLDLFEGNISNINIFSKVEHINPNDAFLDNKGFTILHLLLSKQATIFIPHPWENVNSLQKRRFC